jgi:hypothetical protein
MKEKEFDSVEGINLSDEEMIVVNGGKSIASTSGDWCGVGCDGGDGKACGIACMIESSEC